MLTIIMYILSALLIVGGICLIIIKGLQTLFIFGILLGIFAAIVANMESKM